MADYSLPSYASGCVNRSVLFIYLFNCFFLSGIFVSVVFSCAIHRSDGTVSNNKRTQ